MARRSCDGDGFLAAFRSAVATLEANVDEINSLNVFPVPDSARSDERGSPLPAPATGAMPCS